MRRSVSPMSSNGFKSLFSTVFNKEDIYGKKDERKTISNEKPDFSPNYRSSLNGPEFRTESMDKPLNENKDGTIERISLMNWQKYEESDCFQNRSFTNETGLNRMSEKKFESVYSTYGDQRGQEIKNSDKLLTYSHESELRWNRDSNLDINRNPFKEMRESQSKKEESCEQRLDRPQERNIDRNPFKEMRENQPKKEESLKSKNLETIQIGENRYGARHSLSKEQKENKTHDTYIYDRESNTRKSKRTYSELKIDDLRTPIREPLSQNIEKSKRAKELDIEDWKHKYNRMKEYYKTQLKRMSEELVHYKDLYSKVANQKEIEKVIPKQFLQY